MRINIYDITHTYIHTCTRTPYAFSMSFALLKTKYREAYNKKHTRVALALDIFGAHRYFFFFRFVSFRSLARSFFLPIAYLCMYTSSLYDTRKHPNVLTTYSAVNAIDWMHDAE